MIERRVSIELRADARRLIGYAAVFDTPAQIMDFRETIRPGAFRATLASGADVLALVDHDPSRLLARTKSGTLRLSEDIRGLAFDLSVPNTTLGADILAMVERGDVGGASFGFRVTDEAWLSRTDREIRSVDLAEISIVHAWPAYDATSVNVRSRPLDSAGKLSVQLKLLAAGL